MPQSPIPYLRTLIPWLILSLTLLSIGSSSFGWWLPLELLSHFKLQYGIATLLLLGLWCWIGTPRTRITALLIFGLMVQLTILAPWLSPIATATPKGQPFKLISTNVYFKNLNAQPTIDWILAEQPDAVIFIEVNDTWVTLLDRGLGDRYPHHFSYPRDDSRGIALYSRWPLDSAQLLPLPADSAPTIAATLQHPSGPIDLFALHLPVPFRASLFAARNRQLDALARHLTTKPDRPTLLAGDFNLTQWSPYYDRFLNQTQLINSRRSALASWPSASRVGWLAPLLGIPIDHCLASSDIGVAGFAHGPDLGSDHLPIVADLRVGPSRNAIP
jgi:endonuclease/exonuclease/phosphatase (EEP) superfamily protein YafD